MNETRFIELALRYLDGAARQTEVDQLGADMLEHPGRRAIYRDLVQQAQLAHEWGSTIPARATRSTPKSWRFAVIATAAAAALVLASIILLSNFNPSEPEPDSNRLTEAKLSKNSEEHVPSWADIYQSPFDYPDFVWHAEFATQASEFEAFDEFSDSEFPSPLDATPAREFNRLLAPIAMLPAGESFGSRLY